MSAPDTVYDYVVRDSRHQDFPLSQLKGKVTMFMNVASQCGFTDNGYKVATELYEKYKDQGFMVLGFPCNQFGGQEPGSEAQVVEFACTKFKASFPIMEKVEVNGSNASPVWERIRTDKPGILGTTSVKWNFTVFIVDKRGRTVERFSPGSKTADLEPLITRLLSE